MHVNKKLFPMKGHFLFYNAGIATLMPFLTTYAHQLGLSSLNVGVIYAVLPLFGLIAKLLFSIVADKFRTHKLIFTLCQVFIIISFAALYFVPSIKNELKVELDCGNGVSVIRSCFPNSESIDTCKVVSLGKETTTSTCKMNCKMSSLRMWETVCEHWGIPQYCYGTTSSIQYSSHINNITMKEKCAYMHVNNVTLDGYDFTPHCRTGGRFGDIKKPCSLDCSNQNYSIVINKIQPFMTCINNTLNYELCVNDTAPIPSLLSEAQSSDCQTSCQLDPNSPWQLMEICEGWQADAAKTCQPRISNNQEFPSNLSFIATVKLHSTLIEHECIFVELKHIKLSDYGTVYYPNCIEKAPYEKNASIFHPMCEIDCDNEKVDSIMKVAQNDGPKSEAMLKRKFDDQNNTLYIVQKEKTTYYLSIFFIYAVLILPPFQQLNELFHEAQNDHNSSRFTSIFWLFFMLLIINCTSQAVITMFADAFYLNLLGTKASLYGNRRMWSSLGWGSMALAAGILIDFSSGNSGLYKDYSVAFILMFLFMIMDLFVSIFIKVEGTQLATNILADLGSVCSCLTSLTSFVFLLWVIAVGSCTGLLYQFLFWHIEDIYKLSCEDAYNVKTLQGLISALQIFFGILPFLFCSGLVLKKIGHLNTMSLVLFSFGVRFVLYSTLTNPWWILPVEIFQGITFGIFYPTMMSYATIIAPPGKETSVQICVVAVFEGIGIALGSLIGGLLYNTYGGWNTFQWFGIGCLCGCFLHVIAQYTFTDKILPNGQKQDHPTAIRYEQPNDMVFILEDDDETHCNS